MEETEPNSTPAPVEPPRGMFAAKLDDKGRLKLPAAFQQYFSTLPERKFFVTSLDRRIAQIYPMPAWRENEKFLDGYRANPGAAQVVIFNANDLGADAEMDGQGRLTFNPDLRKALGLEGQELHLYAVKGRVEVLPEPVYGERQRKAMEQAAASLEILEMEGLR